MMRSETKGIVWKILKLLGAACSSLAMTIILIVTLQNLLPGFLKNMLLGYQATSFPFTFQTMMWFPFCIGLFVIMTRFRNHLQLEKMLAKPAINVEKLELTNPEVIQNFVKAYSANKILDKDLVSQVYLSGLEALNYSSRFADAKGQIEAKMGTLLTQLDSDFAKIKYLTWLLPSLGFMGTVYGISMAISEFSALSPEDPAFLTVIARSLSVAFDTTLLSLVQSSLLVFFVTFLESMELGLLTEIENECEKSLHLALRSQQSKQALKGRKAG